MSQFNIKNKGNVMRITNIELLDVNTQSETIYDVKIIIDNCVCLTGIKINLYTDELIVVYPDTIAPVDNKTKIKLDNIILAEATNKRPLNEKLLTWIKK